MQEPALPKDEAARVDALRSLGILDTPPDERYDRFTRSSRRIFDTPMAVISLVDRYRQWFKSAAGLNDNETPRSISFCGHTILGNGVFEVSNALRDPRFRDNPLVVNEPHIRFYAGAPLETPDGYKLGTLCILDRVPRRLSAEEKSILRSLADNVVAQMVDYFDEGTGLASRNALLETGSKCFARMTGKDGYSLHLFKIEDVASEVLLEEPHLSAGKIFATLLPSFYPRAQSIASLGDNTFGVLIKKDNAFDERRAINHLCTLTKNALSDRQDRRPAFVGLVQFSRDHHESFDDVMRDVDAMFFRHQDSATPSRSDRHRFRDAFARLRAAIH